MMAALTISRKRDLIPLLLILSLSTLFLFSLYHSSSPPIHPFIPINQNQNQNQNQNHFLTNNNQDNNNNNYNFTLTIKVLTYNRLPSLSRCLDSLSKARYDNHKVHLHIFLDKPPHNLNHSHSILGFVDAFVWEFGEKTVHYRTSNVGLQGQWLEAWWPASDHDFAFVVEDDLELSPLYYRFLRGFIIRYYYHPLNFHPSIYGASLQRPRFVPGKHGNKLQLNSDDHLFLYQLVGTWGQLLFPKPWKEFRLWYDTQKANDIKPILQGMVTTGWYKKMGERIWTPWFIKFIHSRGYFNMYTNFSHERALSTSHRDAGVNYGKTAGPDSALLDENSLDFNLMEMQSLSELKWYDFCFRQVIPDKVVRNLNELVPVLHSQQKEKTVILVSLVKVSHAITRNLLCHFERLNIRNYVLVGPKSDFLLDLARRGHPVIDMDQFIDNMQTHKLMNFHERSIEMIKEIIVMGYSVQMALEVGYNIWLIDGNILPIGVPLFDVTDSVYDFYVGSAFRVFFARSSSSTKKNWDGFLNKVVSVKALKNKDFASSSERNFVHMVAEALQLKGVNMKSLDEKSFGVRIDSSSIMPSSLSDEMKMIFWSSEIGSDLIRTQLDKLGMWAIDSELSCTAVVCHQP